MTAAGPTASSGSGARQPRSAARLPAHELSDWFREAFVDGFEWVMPPNVIGMSQHADGGMMATKPYSAGGAYVARVFDHCGDGRFNPHSPRATGRGRIATASCRRPTSASLERLADLDAVLEQEAAREVF